MRKAVLKRIKITKTGKLLRRRAGQNHFNAKTSGKIKKNKRKLTEFSGPVERKIKQYLTT